MRSIIKESELKAVIKRLNEALGVPVEPYTKRDDGTHKANIGNHHLYCAYGMFGVHQMANESGGVRVTVQLGTKRETYEALHNILAGLSMAKGE